MNKMMEKYVSMSKPELQKELDNISQSLFKARVQKSTQQLKDTSSIRLLKKDRARILTLIKKIK